MNIQKFRNWTVAIIGLIILAMAARSNALPHKERDELFDTTCDIVYNTYGVSCATLEAPSIVYIDTKKYGLRGYYGLNRVIYVNKKLNDEQRRYTIVHENVHFIMHKLGKIELDRQNKFTLCLSEQVAFTISNHYAFLYSFRQRMNWIDNYPHCMWFKIGSTTIPYSE